MKKTVSLLLTLMLLLAMITVAALPAGAAASDFTYTAENGAVKILKYIGTSEDVVIPAEIDGLPVTQIGNDAFYQNKTIKSVSIPASVKEIGTKAFAGSFVKSVTMSDSVESLGVAAFKDCVYLTDITLSKNIKTISNNAFSYCTRLESIIIPEGITRIDTSAFQSCNHLEGISLPSTLESIGEYAFAYTALVNFKAPESLQKIQSYAFFICEKLETVTLSSNMRVIESWAFANDKNLTEVILNDGLETIGDSAFDTCGIKEIAVPATVTSIGQYAIGYTYDESNFDYIYSEDFVIKCEEGSAAAVYAQDNGFKSAPMETPSEPDTEPDTPSDKYQLGDANMDEVINIRDATTIQKFIVDLVELSDEAQALADYDGDGRISVRDATAIQKFIVGL